MNRSENGEYDKKGNKLSKRIIAGTLAVSAGAFALAGCATEEVGAAPSRTSTTSETIAPTPEQTESPELTVEQLEIPAGLSAEEVGELIVGDRFTEWLNAGANDTLLDRYKQDEEHASWDEFLPYIAQENKNYFADALYISGWEDNPQLVQYVNGSIEGNTQILRAYVATAWNQDTYPENVEPYRQWLEVQSVVELPNDTQDNTRTIEISYKSEDNTDKNVIESKLDGSIEVYTITLTTVGETEKISDISVR